MDYYGPKAYRSDQRKPLTGKPKSPAGALLRSMGQAKDNDAMDHRPCLFAEKGYVKYLAACGCHLDTLEPKQPQNP